MSEINHKNKFMQLFCRHKNTGWYRKISKTPFSTLAGERRYLVCRDCGKIKSDYLAEYEGSGFK